MNHPRSISNAYKKGYSQVTRTFNKFSANKNSIFNKKVNTVRVKDTTARDRAVVTENKGKWANAVKASACWGNPQQKEYKEKEVIDSGCSRHMTGNKCYLTKYEDYDGGFLSFGDGKGRISGKELDESQGLAESSKVLVIKPHTKTPYELIRGRTPLIDFMKPFGCPVTILNTRDHLGKFDGKADEGFFVGYSVDSEEDVGVKPREVDGSEASDKDGKDCYKTQKWCEGLSTRKKKSVHPNSTNSINTVSTPVSTTEPSTTNDAPSSPVNAAKTSEEHLFEQFSPFKNAFTLPDVPNMSPLDDNTRTFASAYDDEDVGTEADLNNLETTMNVSPIPITRIDKDHPKDQIIGDLNLAIQTRRMTKIFDEHAMVRVTLIKRGRTNHKDYQNCLFAYFLSQKESKKVIQALEIVEERD
ncbi:ribonuclease H-like domain-containing protein [Tanacetum coccineum]